MSKREGKLATELENVEHALNASEAFIEKNYKRILTGLGVVILIVLAVLLGHNYILKPREVSAQNEMSKSQLYFAVDSFKVALEGDGVRTIGFKSIASDYSMTASGNLASAYAGICYYKLGQYENAIKYLADFDGKDDYFSTSVQGLIGDAYVNLNQLDKGVKYFEKAIKSNNEVLSPIYLKKLALIYEVQNLPEKAKASFNTIKDMYPKSQEAMEVDKYLARLKK